MFLKNFHYLCIKDTIIMKVEYKQNQIPNGNIQDLVKLLEKSSSVWEYMGMKVEIDPTVDISSQNVLIRWLDLEEGFNDKIIVHSPKEFKTHFKKIDD